ncbi:MAG: hypothetical protein K2K91_04390 [Ruminococcus sp.]|nr:hypothetical protein [Ruminococcus sp.]
MRIVLIDRNRSDCEFYAIIEFDKPFKHPRREYHYVALSSDEKLPRLNVIPFSNVLDRWASKPWYEPVNIEEKDFPEVLIKKIKELYTMEET